MGGHLNFQMIHQTHFFPDISPNNLFVILNEVKNLLLWAADELHKRASPLRGDEQYLVPGT